MEGHTEKYQDIKKAVRDIQLTLMENPEMIELNPERRFNRKYRILMPNRKLIRSLIEEGAILTGSRALKCYSVKGISLLDRKMEDWDFMIDRKTAFKIASKHNIEMTLSDNFISVKNQRRWAHPAYSDSYRIGIVDVNMIITEDLPDFREKDGIRFTNPTYIISEKIKLVESNPIMAGNPSIDRSEKSRQEKELWKHISDLERIIVNFYGNI